VLSLVLVASGLITKSINNWFNVSIERSLEDSLDVSRNYYRLIEQDALHFGEQLRTVLLGRICYGTTERRRWRNF
jgi:nitrogen fixation/metabolism regulation signal transduction histidine kinase